MSPNGGEGELRGLSQRKDGESFFDYEYLREFEDKIETARNVV